MRKIKRAVSSVLILALALLTSCSAAESSAETEQTEEVTEALVEDVDTFKVTTASEGSSEIEDTVDISDDNIYNGLFDCSYVHDIDVEIFQENWSDLLKNPLKKKKYRVSVTIDGEKLSDVSFSTKGNTSLSSVAANKDSDRYSFRLNFGKYVDDQTYHGLDRLNLNNIYGDATYMKDYLSYHLFNYMEVDAPLTSFVNLTVNGEPQGLYLAVEEVSTSFLERTGNTEGELYKPETETMNSLGQGGPPAGGPLEGAGQGIGQGVPAEGGTLEGMPPAGGPLEGAGQGVPAEGGTLEDAGQGGTLEGTLEDPPEGFTPPVMNIDDKGASLKYTDDEIDSYPAIFDNAETAIDESDKIRLVSSLKALSEGNINASVDMESVIDYFVVHNFVMNYDSYTGHMLHNFFLYEEDGRMKMIPWDYNLAFGAFANGSGGKQDNFKEDWNGSREDNVTVSSVNDIINYGIDTPLMGASEEDRPMWSWIKSDEEYLNRYHERFDKLVIYLGSEEFNNELDRIYDMIYPYVENDPSAFYNVDEFKKGFETLRSFVELRSESIRKQLDGMLSAVTEEQSEDEKVEAGDLSINDMGSHEGWGQ